MLTSDPSSCSLNKPTVVLVFKSGCNHHLAFLALSQRNQKVLNGVACTQYWMPNGHFSLRCWAHFTEGVTTKSEAIKALRETLGGEVERTIEQIEISPEALVA